MTGSPGCSTTRVQILSWNAVDARLRVEHDVPLTWFEPMRIVARVDENVLAHLETTLELLRADHLNTDTRRRA